MSKKIVYKDSNTGTLVTESVDTRQPDSVYLNRFPGSVMLTTNDFPTDGGPFFTAWQLNPTPFQKVQLATTATLPDSPSYSNGVITSTGNPTNLTIDGVVASNTNRILVKDQATNTENGIYTVTNDGTAANTNWELTRSSDFVEIMTPLYVDSVIKVDSGTTNGGYSFKLDATVNTIDTDAVTFSIHHSVFSSPVKLATTTVLPDSPTYSNNVITSTGNPVNLTIDSVVASNGDRILVQDQSTNTENGIYTVTNDGLEPNTNWELTRATDFDSSVTPIYANSVISVTSGSVNSGGFFKLDTTVNTIDTDAVIFSSTTDPNDDYSIVVDMPTARDLKRDQLRNQRTSDFTVTDAAYIEAISEGKETADIKTRQVYLRDITNDAAINAAANCTALSNVTISSWTPPDISAEPYCDYTRTEVNTATYTVLGTDNVLGVTYTSTGAVTLTLPLISTTGCKRYVIKDEGANAGTNNITINVSGSDTIDGASSHTINTNYGKVLIYNDHGTGWFIV